MTMMTMTTMMTMINLMTMMALINLYCHRSYLVIKAKELKKSDGL